MLIQQVVIFPAENAGGVLCQGENAVCSELGIIDLRGFYLES